MVQGHSFSFNLYQVYFPQGEKEENTVPVEGAIQTGSSIWLLSWITGNYIG